MALKQHFMKFILFCFFTSYFKSLTADTTNSSFTFKNFGQSSTFDSVLSLYGGAKVVNDGQSLQLTTGRVIYKNPIKFYSGTPKKLVSFSTYFEFSMTSGFHGDGLAFVVFSGRDDLFGGNGSFGVSNRSGFKFLSVEFDTLMDDKYKDINGNHVGIDLSSFVSFKVVNLSSINLGLNRGTRLQVWIDYEAGSERLEVRVNKFGGNRPVDPLLFGEIDISKIWPENDGFFVGLSSVNGNESSQACNVYSWRFKTRKQPDLMHSEPLDPYGFKGKGKEINIKVHKENDCVLWIVSALILGIGLGGLGSFVGVLMWTVFAKRRPIAPEEYAVKPVVDEKGLSK